MQLDRTLNAKAVRLFAVFVAGLAIAACASQMEPAKKLLGDVEAAVTAAGADAAQYIVIKRLPPRIRIPVHGGLELHQKNVSRPDGQVLRPGVVQRLHKQSGAREQHGRKRHLSD